VSFCARLPPIIHHHCAWSFLKWYVHIFNQSSPTTTTTTTTSPSIC
jgi:hypothetical protein